MRRVRSTSRSPTITVALFAGFGLTLGLWIFAWYNLTTRIADVEGEATNINARYMRAQDLLSTVRTQVLLGSVFARDALLAKTPAAARRYESSVANTYRTATAALADYVPVLGTPAERDGVDRLRREVDDFHREMLAVLKSDIRTRTREPQMLLQQRVMPRREIAVRISEQVQALNRSAFVAQSQATAAVYVQTQRHAWQQLGLALAASLAIAAWAGIYSRRLEARLRRQRDRDVQLTNELHRLSAKIVSAQEDERRMIARELHDEVGQALAAIRVELAYARQPGERPEIVTRRLDEVRAITEGALHSIRDLSHLLHPAALDDLGLVAALDALLRSFEQRQGVQTALTAELADVRLPQGLEITIYRIAQEALNNIARHAMARHCRLLVSMPAGRIRIVVADDGVGFSLGQAGAAAEGLGLIGIRERAGQFGGTLEIESAPGYGTRLIVDLPLPPFVSDPAVVSPVTLVPDAVEDVFIDGTLANLHR